MNGECSIRLSSGVRLAYAEQGARDGSAVLFLHGYSDSHRSFAPMARHLWSCWRALALTQRGHGDSDKPDGYAISDFAADVPLFLDALGIERAFVVGHSMGAAVALQAGADFPDRVAGIALVGAFADFAGNAGVVQLCDLVAGFEDPVDPAFVRSFQESTLANVIAPEFLALVIAESLKMPARVWRGIATGLMDFNPIAAARRCTVPAAILWGDQDSFAPRVDQLALRDALHAVHIHTLAGVGHAVHWERPAETADRLNAFLAEIDGAAALVR